MLKLLRQKVKEERDKKAKKRPNSYNIEPISQ